MLTSTPLTDFGPPMKRGRMTPPTSERVMLYVRQENEEVYTPLHVVPPTTIGLLNAVSEVASSTRNPANQPTNQPIPVPKSKNNQTKLVLMVNHLFCNFVHFGLIGTAEKNSNK